MVCHALGRCRICARKHKLPIFGSEENQHALIEKVHLQLIVLNTVCIDCIAKFEQFVKKNASAETLESSALQRQQTDCYRSNNEAPPIAECGNLEARPSMQFYVETAGKTCPKIRLPCENERITLREDFRTQQKLTHHTQNRILINDATELRLARRTDVPTTATKVRVKRKVQCQLCCDFCAKEFTHRGDLKRHKRKHTGEKPYECPECQKTFSQLSNLTRHRLVHSGERPFACADCGQSYSRKGRLANHIGRELCRRKRRFLGLREQIKKLDE